MIVWQSPAAFLALAIIPLIWWTWYRRPRRAAFVFADGVDVGGLQATLRSRIRVLLPVLRTLAAVCLVLALARPQRADEKTTIKTEGLAIQLVLDRSESMRGEDFRGEDGLPARRIDAVKNVVRRFIAGDGDTMTGRESDLVGLIAFGTYADTECPLTHDHRHLLRALDDVEPLTTQEEGRTAIGDALLLAVERMRDIGRRSGEDKSFEVKSRIVILLTDGDQTAGKYQPSEAAKAAAAFGIRVYAIGAAPSFQNVGGRTQRAPINEDALEQVARMTDGRFYRATDAGALRRIYEEIDSLERSVVQHRRVVTYHDMAHAWIPIGDMNCPPLLMCAMLLFACEMILANTRLRKIP